MDLPCRRSFAFRGEAMDFSLPFAPGWWPWPGRPRPPSSPLHFHFVWRLFLERRCRSWDCHTTAPVPWVVAHSKVTPNPPNYLLDRVCVWASSSWCAGGWWRCEDCVVRSPEGVCMPAARVCGVIVDLIYDRECGRGWGLKISQRPGQEL